MGNMGTFNKPLGQILTDAELGYHVIYLILCLSGLCIHPFFFSVLLFDVVYREETLINNSCLSSNGLLFIGHLKMHIKMHTLKE